MTNNDNQLVLSTDVVCIVCTGAVVFKCTRITRIRDKEMFGPADVDHEYRHEYYCENCGITYVPTRTNELHLGHKKTIDLAQSIIRDTSVAHVISVSPLMADEVFLIETSSSWFGQTCERFINSSGFKFPTEVRKYISDEYGTKPYIMPPTETDGSEIILYSAVVLPDDDPRKIRWRGVDYHGVHAKDHDMKHNEYSTRAVPILLESAPPPGAVPAVKVFHPVLRKHFYIPKDKIGVLK